ncbi:hypothetical protein [Vibrio agarivorans]|uniref:hypothetical protein n=1 Tax=Vibrio agarivorans TaxID=153622 RepID=UPI0025B3F7A3|nr:hypothetical protein [Vibrio agarivorans]MDN3660399.1 hypothetical protein [Vibrio agarivorans]
MFKKTVLASLFVTALAGCSSISGEDAATLNRTEMNEKLTQTCEELGNSYTPVSVAVDTASEVMVSIQDRQCKVFQSYNVLASKHGDVAGFLAVNSGLTDEELLAAMEEFDADKPEDKKIAPQVNAYKTASDSIFDSNVELGLELAVQAAQISMIAADNATVLAQETGLAMFSNILASASVEEDEEAKDVVPIVAAYDELTSRSALAYEANNLISLDQNTIKQLENLDKILSEQVN